MSNSERKAIPSKMKRCPGCDADLSLEALGFSRRWDGTDPWFGLPLYLSQAVGRHILWAHNLAHIEALDIWLGAKHRERSLSPYYMQVMARLPRWMKLAHTRQPIHAALARLRDKASEAGICQ